MKKIIISLCIFSTIGFVESGQAMEAEHQENLQNTIKKPGIDKSKIEQSISTHVENEQTSAKTASIKDLFPDFKNESIDQLYLIYKETMKNYTTWSDVDNVLHSPEMKDYSPNAGQALFKAGVDRLKELPLPKKLVISPASFAKGQSSEVEIVRPDANLESALKEKTSEKFAEKAATLPMVEVARPEASLESTLPKAKIEYVNLQDKYSKLNNIYIGTDRSDIYNFYYNLFSFCKNEADFELVSNQFPIIKSKNDDKYLTEFNDEKFKNIINEAKSDSEAISSYKKYENIFKDMNDDEMWNYLHKGNNLTGKSTPERKSLFKAEIGRYLMNEENEINESDKQRESAVYEPTAQPKKSAMKKAENNDTQRKKKESIKFSDQKILIVPKYTQNSVEKTTRNIDDRMDRTFYDQDNPLNTWNDPTREDNDPTREDKDITTIRDWDKEQIETLRKQIDENKVRKANLKKDNPQIIRDTLPTKEN